MKAIIPHAGVNRRVLLSTLAALPALGGPLLSTASDAWAQSSARPLDSWNDGPAKQAILDFVRATTDPASPTFARREERIATFDQDGTLWVEHPMYSQVMFCASRFPLLTGDRALLEYLPRFRGLADGNLDAVADLSKFDLEIIAAATLTGMTVQQFAKEVTAWIAAAKDPRWKRPYTELTYLPMQEMMSYFARTDTRLTLSPEAARTLCASTPIQFTASRPSRLSAVRAERRSATPRTASRY